MATQQEVDYNWINFQNKNGAYANGGVTDYQQGMLEGAINTTPGPSTQPVVQPENTTNTGTTNTGTIVPEGYHSTASIIDRYNQGSTTASGGGLTTQGYQAGSSDSDFLDRVYNNETGRAADEWGKSYWQGELDAGKSREDIISAFNNTAEGKGFDNPITASTAPVGAAGGVITGAKAHGYEPTGYNAAPKANVTGYSAPDQAVTKGYDATNQAITPDQMSGDRMAQLLAGDSKYIAQARNDGLLAAHKRGALNSAMAAGMSEAAAIRAAMPLAQQEAGVYANAATNYANAQNRADEFGSREFNVASLQENQQQDAASRFGAAAENLADREYTSSVNAAEQYGATAINRAGEFYAGAQNTASIQNANNELSLALQGMRDDMSTYSTDAQRATALDNVGLNLFNTAVNSGVFQSAETIQGYFNTVSSIFPDLGIQMIEQTASAIPEGVIA